jgi:hypothetical protein
MEANEIKLNELISDSITVKLPTKCGFYTVPFLEDVIFGVFIVILFKEYSNFKDAYTEAFHSQGAVHINERIDTVPYQKTYSPCKYFSSRKNAINFALENADNGYEVFIVDTINGGIITPTVRETFVPKRNNPSRKSWSKVKERIDP